MLPTRIKKMLKTEKKNLQMKIGSPKNENIFYRIIISYLTGFNQLIFFKFYNETIRN